MMIHVHSATGRELTTEHPANSRMTPLAQSRAPLEMHLFRGDALQTIEKSGELDRRLVCLLRPTSALAESYFRLRRTLEEMHSVGGGVVVGLTSPAEGDGKTLTAINLAGALAQDRRAKVLLVDLNLRRSRANVHGHFGMRSAGKSGVADWIGNDKADNDPASYHLPALNLHLILSGVSAISPYKLLASPRLEKLFEQARQRYDFVIVDTPQILRLPDIELIARLVDSFLIVVRANATSKSELDEALNLMTHDKVLGLVFNETRTHP